MVLAHFFENNIFTFNKTVLAVLPGELVGVDGGGHQDDLQGRPVVEQAFKNHCQKVSLQIPLVNLKHIS
jgi:hypothetical protein